MALLLDLLVTGKTRLNDDTYAKNIYADKFIKTGSSDNYVLLGGGGHKALNDFSMKNHTHSEYLPLTGGTLSGPLEINSTLFGNYEEGLRITAAPNDWAGITFGSTDLSGAPTKGWYAGRDPNDYFIISPDERYIETGLTLIPYGDALWIDNKIWHAGNDGAGSTLDADMTDGLHVHAGTTNNEPNKIIRTDSTGHLRAGYINTNVNTQDNLECSRLFFESGNDGYIRKMTPARFRELIIDSMYLPSLRMRNPSTSNNAPGQGGIPFPLSLKGAGCPLYEDPEFALGTNDVTVYKLNGAVTLTRIPDNQKSNNSSGHILQISTSAGAASPGRGGFYQKIPAKPNAVYAQIFRAKIPVGFSVVNAENPMGTHYSTHWLTDTAGTGKWEWYIRVTICGKEGTFNESGGGHVYLNGTGAVTWYLSYCNVIDLTMGNYDSLRTKYSDFASHITVNPRDNNANYSMVFQYGTSLCSSTGIYCNPNTGYMYSNGVDTSTLKCNSKFTLVPTNTDDTGQAIAGATAPVVLVTSATAVNVPAGNANGAMVILVKVGTRDKTYRALNGIKFYCCWEGGARNTTSFTQTQNSCMMIYNNNVWYVMQFS